MPGAPAAQALAQASSLRPDPPEVIEHGLVLAGLGIRVAMPLVEAASADVLAIDVDLQPYGLQLYRSGRAQAGHQLGDSRHPRSFLMPIAPHGSTPTAKPA